MAIERPSLSGPLHALTHGVGVILGWATFGVSWWVVLQRPAGSLSDALWLIGVAIVMLPVITLYWVLHNRRIYARKGPRRRVQIVETSYREDWAGRVVHADFDQVRQARQITIDSTHEKKRFLTSDTSFPA